MPEMSAGRRAAGGQATRAARDSTSLLPWVNGEWPDLPTPDQSRYGPRGTTDSPRLPATGGQRTK